MDKIIIYDFDGTLTPYPVPHFEIFRNNNLNEKDVMDNIHNIMKEKNTDMYEGFCLFVFSLIKKGKENIELEDITKGVENTAFSKGLVSFLKRPFPCRSYILTSGFYEYVSKTVIARYFNKIYGTILKKKGNNILGINYLLTADEKIKAIDQILKDNNSEGENVFYLGDGLTDGPAMKYIKDKGGIPIYLYETEEDLKVFSKMKEQNMVDVSFRRDFSKNSELDLFLRE